MDDHFNDYWHNQRVSSDQHVISSGHIFVSVASYRDIRCLATIRDMFEQAANPQKLWVGVCQQNAPSDQFDCIPNEFKSHIQIVRMGHTDAKGPTWARYLCTRLWAGQQYFLQIDSHTKFVHHWDKKTKDMYDLLPAKSIITYYPPNETSNVSDVGDLETKTTHTCGGFVNEKNELIATAQTTPRTPYPRRARFASGNFFFTTYKFLMEVPWDPYLPFIFQGEEPLLSMRAFTNGWDMYHPTHCVCDHYYTRSDEPKFWNELSEQYKKYNPLAVKRCRYFLGIEAADTDVPWIYKHSRVYGPGKQRSLRQWHHFIGVDWKAKTVKQSCDVLSATAI